VLKLIEGQQALGFENGFLGYGRKDETVVFFVMAAFASLLAILLFLCRRCIRHLPAVSSKRSYFSCSESLPALLFLFSAFLLSFWSVIR
jgi:hypothetical protein